MKFRNLFSSLVMVAVSAGFASAASLTWLPKAAGIETSEGPAYDFGYLHWTNGTDTNWNSNATFVNGDSVTFSNNSPLTRNIWLSAPATIGGNSASESSTLLVYTNTFTFDGQPLTLTGATGNHLINLQGGAGSVVFKNEVTIRANDNGATATGSGLIVKDFGGFIEFHNLKMGKPLGVAPTGVTNLSFGNLGTPGQSMIFHKISDAGLNDTGEITTNAAFNLTVNDIKDFTGTLRVGSGGTMNLIGDTSQFAGTLHLQNGYLYFSQNLGNVVNLTLTSGSLGFSPAPVYAIEDTNKTNPLPGTLYINRTIVNNTAVGGSKGSFLITGKGTVIVGDGYSLTSQLGSGTSNMTIGGGTGDAVRLGGGFTFTVDYRDRRRVLVEKGGGFTNEHGMMILDSGLDIAGAIQEGSHRFAYVWNSSLSEWKWNTINATGSTNFFIGSWGSKESLVMGTDYSYTNFEFAGMGQFADGMTLTLFNATYGISGSVSNGDDGWFDLGGNYRGQLEIIAGIDSNPSLAGSQRLVLNVAAIPEPTAWALLGVSLFVVTLFRRKKLS